MDHPPHILAPTSFRPEARLARRRAFQLAAEQQARVTLLHVTPGRPLRTPEGLDALGMLHDVLHRPPDLGCAPTIAPPSEAMQRRAMERLAQEVHPEWKSLLDVRLAWRRGGVLEQILAYAAAEQVDAIVLGMRRPRGGFAWGGPSLVDRILRAAPCEVIVVRVPPADGPPAFWERISRWWNGDPTQEASRPLKGEAMEARTA